MPSLINLAAQIQRLESEIAAVLNILNREVPDGRLIARKTADGNYRYTRKIRSETGVYKELYLGQDHYKEAFQIAEKLTAEQRLCDLQKHLELLKTLFQLQKTESQEASFLRRHPGIASLLAGTPGLINEQANAWKHTAYNRNQKYPEQIRYPTVIPGLLVRSKSEADIISRLEHYGVPYHYDEICSIGNTELAIDLLCINTTSGKFWYWDHRGMMDQENYVNKTLYCESQYYKAGFIPWINMIVTTETKEHPLDIQWVDTIIQYYLL